LQSTCLAPTPDPAKNDSTADNPNDHAGRHYLRLDSGASALGAAPNCGRGKNRKARLGSGWKWNRDGLGPFTGTDDVSGTQRLAYRKRLGAA
jgi:hypothetical protein